MHSTLWIRSSQRKTCVYHTLINERTALSVFTRQEAFMHCPAPIIVGHNGAVTHFDTHLNIAFNSKFLHWILSVVCNKIDNCKAFGNVEAATVVARTKPLLSHILLV